MTPRRNTKEDILKHMGSPAYSFSVLQVTDAYLAQHPQSVQAFVNALVLAERWILSHSDQEVAQVVQPYFPGLDLGLITESVRQDREASCPDGLVTRQGHDMAVRIFSEAGIIKHPVPFEAIVDNSFSAKAQALR